MRARGAAMIETVVVLGVVLTVLFGTFEIGLIGLTQLSEDGGAFLAAHASVMGDSPTGVLASPFPMLNVNAAPGNPNTPAVVTISTSAPDAVPEPVDYQISNQQNRHGGAQVVRPSHVQASINQSSIGLSSPFMHVIPASPGGAGFIEGFETVSDDGFDLAGTNLNSSAGEAGEVNYFNDDGNTPPYFIGFRFLYHCLQWPTFGAKCPAANSPLDAVGLAEILDGTNWNQPINGTNSTTAVFYAMLQHAQVYEHIAQDIATVTAVPYTVTAQPPTGNATTYTSSDAMEVLDPRPQSSSFPTGTKFTNGAPSLRPYATMNAAPYPVSACLGNVYAWDNVVPPGYTIGSGGFGAHPLYITATYPGCVLP